MEEGGLKVNLWRPSKRTLPITARYGPQVRVAVRRTVTRLGAITSQANDWTKLSSCVREPSYKSSFLDISPRHPRKPSYYIGIELRFQLFITMTTLAIILLAYLHGFRQVSSEAFGPRGMYCSLEPSSGYRDLPRVAVHFFPGEYLSRTMRTLGGIFRTYVLSKDLHYLAIGNGELNYQVLRRRTNDSMRVSISASIALEHLEETSGLSRGDLHRMRYDEDRSHILIKTSKGSLRLSYLGCQRYLVGQTFCSPPAADDRVLGLAITIRHRRRYQELDISIKRKRVYRGSFSLDTDRFPMRIGLTKSKEKDFDGILNVMPNGTEASHEYFWNRGEALAWDPILEKITLHFGAWVSRSTGPTPPDVLLSNGFCR